MSKLFDHKLFEHKAPHEQSRNLYENDSKTASALSKLPEISVDFVFNRERLA